MIQPYSIVELLCPVTDSLVESTSDGQVGWEELGSKAAGKWSEGQPLLGWFHPILTFLNRGAESSYTEKRKNWKKKTEKQGEQEVQNRSKSEDWEESTQ